MSEALRRQARAVIAEELDAERDAEGRIHLTETHVRFGAAALGSAAAGLTALQLGAVGYAVAQQGPGAGSIGTEANPLQEIYADTIDRQTDEIRTDTLSIAGNEFVLDADATVANEASNVRVRSDAIEIADGAAWNPAMVEWYGGSAWGGAVVERYNGNVWSQIHPEPAIPDSLVSLYEFEDDSDTSVAVDSEGDNDLNITGSTYTSTSAVGSLALEHAGFDDHSVSQSSVDLVASGGSAAMGIAGWANVQTVDGNAYVFGWGDDSDNYVAIRQGDGSGSGEFTGYLRAGGTTATIGSGVSTPADEWVHLYVEVTDAALSIYVDGVEEASTTHSLDPTAMGSAPYVTGTRFAADDFEGGYSEVIVDDFSTLDGDLSDDGLNSLISRAA